ncbi:hypothetical protein K491DRAFT_683847 [Lophiostoma macrostomum CBS 122681]|uniref:Uncharacterized protein n=1 Tax=Lophiostoma macrostomum CBS 122681 TaxID=1314788 RepID=A0A6A6SNI8_9PLEO|nr:hypothetical protein K491DRAFT_683847 [Lophiostoma macrostomum CBS 122681]
MHFCPGWTRIHPNFRSDRDAAVPLEVELSELQRVAGNLQITILSPVNLAWALVLRLYEGESHCFDYLALARDASLGAIKAAIELIPAMLMCFVGFGQSVDSSLVEVTEGMQEFSADAIARRGTSLAKIPRAMELPGNSLLSNSGVSLLPELLRESQIDRDQDLIFETITNLFVFVDLRTLTSWVGLRERTHQECGWSTIPGRACVLLGAAHPEAHLLDLITEIKAFVLECSPLTAELGGFKLRAAPESRRIFIIEIGKSQCTDLRVSEARELPSHDFYFCITGPPKGTLITHHAQATGLTKCDYHMYDAIGADARSLQFEPCSFDASVDEIYTLVEVGDLLCMLKEEDRSHIDVSSFVARSRPTFLGQYLYCLEATSKGSRPRRSTTRVLRLARLKEHIIVGLFKRDLDTNEEGLLRDLWDKFLNMQGTSKRCDSHKPGDILVIAMRLRVNCRRARVDLSIAENFRNPDLIRMASLLDSTTRSQSRRSVMSTSRYQRHSFRQSYAGSVDGYILVESKSASLVSPSYSSWYGSKPLLAARW